MDCCYPNGFQRKGARTQRAFAHLSCSFLFAQQDSRLARVRGREMGGWLGMTGFVTEGDFLQSTDVYAAPLASTQMDRTTSMTRIRCKAFPS